MGLLVFIIIVFVLIAEVFDGEFAVIIVCTRVVVQIGTDVVVVTGENTYRLRCIADQFKSG